MYFSYTLLFADVNSDEIKLAPYFFKEANWFSGKNYIALILSESCK